MLLIISLFIHALAYVNKFEQHLMDVYNQMNQLKASLSQMEYYTALEKLELWAKSNQLFEEDSMIIYSEHYADLVNVFKHQNENAKAERNDIDLFERETFPEVTDKLKRIILDKEKLIEGDIKELSKLKHQNPEDFVRRFEEFNQLHQKIQEAIDSNELQDISQTLELLESKIMIGLFKTNNSEEVNYFMKTVDKLFKEKGHPKVKEEGIELLSLMRSIISEFLIQMMNDQLEQQIDVLDKELFFSQSKHTHITAKDQYTDLLENIEKNHQNFWKNLLNQSVNVQMLEIIKQQEQTALQIGNRSLQYHQQMDDMIKAMLDRFLN